MVDYHGDPGSYHDGDHSPGGPEVRDRPYSAGFLWLCILLLVGAFLLIRLIAG